MSLRSNTLNRPDISVFNRSRLSSLSSVQHPSFDNEDNIVSTKTTTIVDPYGFTQSVTTETIRALSDGSSVVEKTTQFPKPSSRCNSARSHSRTNTLQDKYNMSRIDEELNNFAYSYLDQRTPSMNKTTQDKSRYEKSADNVRTQPLKVDESERRLKSILKKTPDLGVPDDITSTANPDKNNLNSNGYNSKASDKKELQGAEIVKCTEPSNQLSKAQIPKSLEDSVNSKLVEESATTKIKFAPYIMQSQKKNLLQARMQSSNEATDSANGGDQEEYDVGVKYNYRYQNHHRKFKAHSLRFNRKPAENSSVDSSSRATNRMGKDHDPRLYQTEDLEDFQSKTGMTQSPESPNHHFLQPQELSVDAGLLEKIRESSRIQSQNSHRQNHKLHSQREENKLTVGPLTDITQGTSTETRSLEENPIAADLEGTSIPPLTHAGEVYKKKGGFRAFVHKFISK